MIEQSRVRQQHRHRVGDVLAFQRGGGAVGRFGHGDARSQVLVERHQYRFGTRNRSEHGEHHVAEAVAIAVQGGNDEGILAGLGQEAGIGGVDESRSIRHIRVTARGGVHFLLEHSFVHRRDSPLRSSVHRTTHLGGHLEGVFRHIDANRTFDALRAPGGLVLALTLTTFEGAVGIAHSHTNHHNGLRDAHGRSHARNAPTGANNHRPVNTFTQKSVRRAHPANFGGRHGGGLEAQPGGRHRVSGFADNVIVSTTTVLQAEIKVLQSQRNTENRRIEDAQ